MHAVGFTCMCMALDERCIFYRLSMRIRKKISSHGLHPMRMRCRGQTIGARMRGRHVHLVGWVFKWLAGYPSAVSAIQLLRASTSPGKLSSSIEHCSHNNIILHIIFFPCKLSPQVVSISLIP